MIRFILPVALLLAAICPSPAAEQRPNIVVFMADDWSYPHAGAYGDKTVATPNFDRIAREGILFHHAFVSTPSCTPSRLSILTGQHVWRLKEGDSLGGSLREEFDVYTEMLEKSGYRIGRYGKGVWPSKHRFRNRDSFGTRFKSFGAFIRERNGDEPFCFWYGGKDPHRPYESGIGEKSGIDLASIKVPACLPDNATVRSDLADYYWCVQRFDREVGEVLERLEKMGELENTLIVISGDNGMPFPRCKATLYDLGTRVPLAVRWGKRLKSGRRVEDFVNLCDLAPTMLRAAGMHPGMQMTGASLMPILLSEKAGQVDPQRTFVVTGMEKHVYPNPSRALRTGDFLYLRNFDPAGWQMGQIEGENPKYDFAKQPWPTGPGAFSFNIDPSPSKQSMRLNRNTPEAKLTFARRPSEELYDLKSDPAQLNNIADDPARQSTLEKLRHSLDRELRTSGDPRAPK
ncbi:MAG: N-sulfoglucosamine sulfohydrolase [Verrucomicrobiales bacterium]|jgi:N-sulfoglucosamine sulfohydrolase